MFLGYEETRLLQLLLEMEFKTKQKTRILNNLNNGTLTCYPHKFSCQTISNFIVPKDIPRKIYKTILAI